jgi:hypothetical protein
MGGPAKLKQQLGWGPIMGHTLLTDIILGNQLSQSTKLVLRCSPKKKPMPKLALQCKNQTAAVFGPTSTSPELNSCLEAATQPLRKKQKLGCSQASLSLHCCDAAAASNIWTRTIEMPRGSPINTYISQNTRGSKPSCEQYVWR